MLLARLKRSGHRTAGGGAPARAHHSRGKQRADDDTINDRPADVGLDQPPVVQDAENAGEVDEPMERFQRRPPSRRIMPAVEVIASGSIVIHVVKPTVMNGRL